MSIGPTDLELWRLPSFSFADQSFFYLAQSQVHLEDPLLDHLRYTGEGSTDQVLSLFSLLWHFNTSVCEDYQIGPVNSWAPWERLSLSVEEFHLHNQEQVLPAFQGSSCLQSWDISWLFSYQIIMASSRSISASTLFIASRTVMVILLTQTGLCLPWKSLHTLPGAWLHFCLQSPRCVQRQTAELSSGTSCTFMATPMCVL